MRLLIPETFSLFLMPGKIEFIAFGTVFRQLNLSVNHCCHGFLANPLIHIIVASPKLRV